MRIRRRDTPSGGPRYGGIWGLELSFLELKLSEGKGHSSLTCPQIDPEQMGNQNHLEEGSNGPVFSST